MPNEKTDSKGFATENADTQEDLAAKGGPGVGLGDTSHTVVRPYNSDLQTQIAAKSTKPDTSDDNSADKE